MADNNEIIQHFQTVYGVPTEEVRSLPDTAAIRPAAVYDEPAAVADEPASVSDETTSGGEVVSGEIAPAPENIPVPLPPIDRNRTPRTEAPATTTSLNDIIDCPSCQFPSCNNNRYPVSWQNQSRLQRAQKIHRHVETINQMHNIRVDPRFLICMAYRESTFNPLAANCQAGATAAGMYQVTDATAVDSVRSNNLRSRLPGYTGLNGEQYKRRMAQSSLAQTEMAIMTLMLKAELVDEEDFLRNSGTASMNDYSKIARAYYGLFREGQSHYAASIRYRDAIMSCYRCLNEGGMARNGTVSNTRSFEGCLQRAK